MRQRGGGRVGWEKLVQKYSVAVRDWKQRRETH